MLLEIFTFCQKSGSLTWAIKSLSMSPDDHVKSSIKLFLLKDYHTAYIKSIYRKATLIEILIVASLYLKWLIFHRVMVPIQEVLQTV